MVGAFALLYHHVFSYIKPMALKCAVELGIPDAIHRRGGAATLTDIAADTGVHASRLTDLRCLMKLLTTSGMFGAAAATDAGGEPATTVYTLTAASGLVVGPRGLSTVVRFAAGPVAVSPFFDMHAWLRAAPPTPGQALAAPPPAARSLFELAHGRSRWDVANADNDTMNAHSFVESQLLIEAVLRDHGDVFRGLGSLVDVGGGHGAVAKAIATAFPDIKCTVMDLPHVVADAPVSDDGNLHLVAGDMFQSIPPADAVLLKALLRKGFFREDEKDFSVRRSCPSAPRSCKDEHGVSELENALEMLPKSCLHQTNNAPWQHNRRPPGYIYLSCKQHLVAVKVFLLSQEFHSKIPSPGRDAHHIDRWVSFSAASRAREILLDLRLEEEGTDMNDTYSFPLHIFSGDNCVRSLSLGFVTLTLPPHLSGFTNLKKLGLHMVSIRGDLQCLLSRCDVMEWLSLTHCSLQHRSICQKLRRLRYLCVRKCRLQKLDLQAPNLTEFELTNYPIPIVLRECLNLSVAMIELVSFSDCLSYVATELPAGGLYHVQDRLSINMTVGTESQGFAESIGRFNNLKHLILNIDVHGSSDNVGGILRLASLLEMAHLYCLSAPIYVKPQLDKLSSVCLHKHLRTVRMTGFNTTFGQLELAFLILRSAPNLDRLIVDPMVRVA
uniref:O-methyltransferase domain-containing protein n=1 Tax=Oryza punctata TaxID=4537 RepID=A0A0E0MG32_ORYPU